MATLLNRVFVAVSFVLACAFVVVAAQGRITAVGEEDRLKAIGQRIDALTGRVDALAKQPAPEPDKPNKYRPRLDPEQFYDIKALGPSRGPADARVVVVEFMDLECPFCKRAQNTLDQLMEQYPNDVRVVYRHNPLAFHKEARPRARLLECAEEQDQFWTVHDALWKLNRGEEPGVAGLDAQRLEACLASKRPDADIDRDIAAAKRVGATGTPTFFINGRPLTGAQPLAKFVERVEQELATQR